MNVGNPNCHADPGFITKATALGSYTIPKIDVLLSGTLRSDQGGVLTATWNAPVATVTQALGRPAAVAGTTVPITLVKPGERWGDRVNALDLRFARFWRFGRVRYNVGIDLMTPTNSRDPDLQPDLQPGGDDRRGSVAGADVGADAALREARGPDRFLNSRGGRLQAARTRPPVTPLA